MKAIKQDKKIHKDDLIKHEIKDEIRLNKYISDSGYCSRREADKIIELGKVKINNEVAVVGSKVKAGDLVTVSGKKVTNNQTRIYLMLNKPVGITCTNDLNVKGNIRTFVNYKELVFPIGRLDKDSSGLILLTNDGDIVNKILRAEYGHEKEYVVTVDKDIDNDFITKMASGVTIYNQAAHKKQKTLETTLEKLDSRTFKIILRQGLNRQIRRMTKELGFNVVSLRRIRIMDLRLGDLKVGEYRYLTNDELISLNKKINAR
ncbi:pseudouridine synthase [Haploplasma modicum]|uniref:pseudouridine synthase n=1 Tax=Haploplasma modicum TaxID=2150 RepID=UPI00214C94B8|nr:pseudouridine synthase [Haploplasma modicum]MCR1809414.1 pseudouridine synthase [Haploplasma modicum]